MWFFISSMLWLFMEDNVTWFLIVVHVRRSWLTFINIRHKFPILKFKRVTVISCYVNALYYYSLIKYSIILWHLAPIILVILLGQIVDCSLNVRNNLLAVRDFGFMSKTRPCMHLYWFCIVDLVIFLLNDQRCCFNIFA